MKFHVKSLGFLSNILDSFLDQLEFIGNLVMHSSILCRSPRLDNFLRGPSTFQGIMCHLYLNVPPLEFFVAQRKLQKIIKHNF